MDKQTVADLIMVAVLALAFYFIPRAQEPTKTRLLVLQIGLAAVQMYLYFG